MSVKPMVMRDPVTLASVELRGVKLNEPVLPVAPASVVLTFYRYISREFC